MLNKFLRLFFPMFFCEPERARDNKGRLRADDKSTPTVNEAWVGGKAPVKKKRGRPPKAKIAAPVTSVRAEALESFIKKNVKKKRGRPPKK